MPQLEEKISSSKENWDNIARSMVGEIVKKAFQQRAPKECLEKGGKRMVRGVGPPPYFTGKKMLTICFKRVRISSGDAIWLVQSLTDGKLAAFQMKNGDLEEVAIELNNSILPC